jgi:hypothetical protein
MGKWLFSGVRELRDTYKPQSIRFPAMKQELILDEESKRMKNALK